MGYFNDPQKIKTSNIKPKILIYTFVNLVLIFIYLNQWIRILLFTENFVFLTYPFVD